MMKILHFLRAPGSGVFGPLLTDLYTTYIAHLKPLLPVKNGIAGPIQKPDKNDIKLGLRNGAKP